MRKLLVILSFVLVGFMTSCEKDVRKLITNDLVGEWDLERVQYYQIIDGKSVEVEPEKVASLQLHPDQSIIVTQSNIAYVINDVRVYHSHYTLIRGMIYTDWLSDYIILEYDKDEMVLKIQDPPSSSKYYVLYYRRLSDKVY